MRVKAIAPGYYDLKRKKEGEEFVVKSEKEFSAKWMEALDKPEKKDPPALKKPKGLELGKPA